VIETAVIEEAPVVTASIDVVTAQITLMIHLTIGVNQVTQGKTAALEGDHHPARTVNTESKFELNLKMTFVGILQIHKMTSIRDSIVDRTIATMRVADAEMITIAAVVRRRKKMSIPTSRKKLLTTQFQMLMNTVTSFSGTGFNGFQKLSAS
jgi:hypothetical protein